MIKILFFARIREQLGVDCLEWPVDAALSLAQLRQQLVEQRGGNWRAVLMADNILIALNQTVVAGQRLEHTTVNAGDEVAFFPPVTGG